MRFLGGCELDTSETELEAGRFLCLELELELSRLGRWVGSSNFTTHWTIEGLFLAAALEPHVQVWVPLCLGTMSGRGLLLRS